MTGIEPATSWSQTTRAPICATPRRHLLLYEKIIRLSTKKLKKFKKLKNIINATSMEALYLRLENIVDNKSLGDAVVLRVFRNNKLYRFRNKMHEQVIFSIEENGGKDKIQATNLT